MEEDGGSGGDDGEAMSLAMRHEEWSNMEEDEGSHHEVGDHTDDNEEVEPFNIELAASHSYMGSDLVDVSGRAVLEPGWTSCLPGRCHSGAVFPGETVPMLLADETDAALLLQAMQRDKLFLLLSPDETGAFVSNYGVICEVFEASHGAGTEAQERRREPTALSFKARATQRCRLKERLRARTPVYLFDRIQELQVTVLPEVVCRSPLGGARPPELRDPVGDRHHDDRWSGRAHHAALVSAAGGVWPRWVYDMFDYRRLRAVITRYWRDLGVDAVPSDPVRLSFWTASNLLLTARDRLLLLAEDSALLRLHREARLIARKSAMCCVSCGGEVARREHVIAMSSDGVHALYTNLGGFMHDIVTVSTARNVLAGGAPSEEFSWFPGYAWSIALCAGCRRHVGWRFDACRRTLRPLRFFALCRNYVQPRARRRRRADHDDDTDDDGDTIQQAPLGLRPLQRDDL